MITVRAAARALVSGLSLGLLLVVLGLAAIVIVVPMATGSQAYTVLTGSMQPSLPPGTLIVVKPAEPAEIRLGDIITYQLESGKPAVATHRVVARTNDTRTGEVFLTTQGDANSLPDAAPVSPVQVRGTLWYAVPYIGWVNNVLSGDTRSRLVPVISGVLLAYAVWMLVAGIKDRREGGRAEAGPAPVGSPSRP